MEFEAGELLGKRLKQAVELSGAKLKGRLDVGIGNAFGRILQLTKLTGDLRESFQTTVFDDHAQHVRDFLREVVAAKFRNQVAELIVSQLRIANQRGDFRILSQGSESFDDFKILGHIFSAGITVFQSLHQALCVGARNRRKFSHS